LGTVTKQVNYSILYMKAVKALQEAMDRIEQLEARVATLEG
jgi:chaperonin cofactor prefoldin